MSDSKWPCRNCGADHAPTFTYDPLKQAVTQCANCEAIKRNVHLESEHCWCHPRLAYVDPKTGDEHWIHNVKH